MRATSRQRRRVRVREPQLLGLIVVATLVIVGGVVSIGETRDAWLVALVVVVMLALAGGTGGRRGSRRSTPCSRRVRSSLGHRHLAA